MPDAGMSNLTPGVPSALSPLVRRIVAPNPGPFTGPGTNTYLVGIDEVAVIDPGPDDQRHIDAIVGASMRERVRWVLLTHTHPDHSPGTARLVKATGAEVLALRQAARQGRRRRPRPRHRRRRHHRGHRVRPRGAAHARPRAQPPLLPARGGTRPLHRRHRARRHVLGDQPAARRRHGRVPRVARAPGEAAAVAALVPRPRRRHRGAAAADPGVRRAPPRPGAPGAGAAEERARARSPTSSPRSTATGSCTRSWSRRRAGRCTRTC